MWKRNRMRFRGVDETKDYKETKNAIAEFTHTSHHITSRHITSHHITTHRSLYWTKVCLLGASTHSPTVPVLLTGSHRGRRPFPLPHGSPSGIWRQNEIPREPWLALQISELDWLDPDPSKTSLLHLILPLLFSRTCSQEAPKTVGLAPKASAPIRPGSQSRAEPPPVWGRLCSFLTLSDLDRIPTCFSNKL